MSSVFDRGGGAKPGGAKPTGRRRAKPGAGAGGGGPVLLTTVYDPLEAEIIVAKLRSAGIEAFARHEALSVVFGLTFDGAGQQDIMVQAEDLDVARAALEQTP